jgi:hypothetical protein
MSTEIDCEEALCRKPGEIEEAAIAGSLQWHSMAF